MFKNLLFVVLFFVFCVPAVAQRHTDHGTHYHTLHTTTPDQVSGNGDNMDVVYHRITWRVNPDSASKGIKGTIVTHFRTTVPNVTQLTFDMNTTALSVTAARFRGAALPGASIVESGNTLTISLGTNIASVGTLDSISIDYNGVPPNPSGSSIGFIKTTRATGRNVVYTVSQPYEDRNWWICKQDMNDKIDSMDIYVNVPNTFKAATNGVLQSTTVSGSNLIYHWKHRYPIPAYLVCLGIADYVQYNSPNVNVSGTSVPVMHYLYPPQNTATVQGYCNLSGQMLDTFSNYFGDYPYKNEKYGQYQMTSYGGMEHATFSAMSTSALTSWSVTAHELGHQWFGDKVTCATFNHIWLNEGWATYTEVFAAEKVPNGLVGSVATQRSSVKANALSTPESPYLTVAATTNDIFGPAVTTQIYDRGAIVISMLRVLMGDAKFFQGVRNYLNDPANAYGAVTTDDFKTHMEAASGYNLTEFFNDWVYGKGNCTYNVTWGSLGKKISLQLTQVSATGTGYVTHFDTPLPIKILGAGVDTTVVIFDQNGAASAAGARNIEATTTSGIIRFQLSFVPTGISIDPDNLSAATAGTVTNNAVLALEDAELFGSRRDGYNALNFSIVRAAGGRSFVLETSTNGTSFSAQANISKTSADAVRDYYTYNDNLAASVTYYRVRYADRNGATQYSNIIKITYDKQNRLKVLSNPVKNGLLSLSLPELTGSSDLNITAAGGKTVLSRKVAAGTVLLNNLEVGALPAGVYIITLKTEDGRMFGEKMIIGR